MSVQRHRRGKSEVRGDAGGRVRGSKSTGNTLEVVRPQDKNSSKSKTKIPSNLRYDLETALVGLCDVWFEEIKPYLLKNKVKLHVHGGPAGGSTGAGGGDSPRGEGASSHSRCTHQHPGAASDRRRQGSASCADCCTKRTAASPAPSARRARQRRCNRRRSPAPLPPPPPPQQLMCRTAKQNTRNTVGSQDAIRVLIIPKSKLRQCANKPRINLERRYTHTILTPTKLHGYNNFTNVRENHSQPQYFEKELKTRGTQTTFQYQRYPYAWNKDSQLATTAIALHSRRSTPAYNTMTTPLMKDIQPSSTSADMVTIQRRRRRRISADDQQQFRTQRQKTSLAEATTPRSKAPRQKAGIADAITNLLPYYQRFLKRSQTASGDFTASTSEAETKKIDSVECLYLTPRKDYASTMNLLPIPEFAKLRDRTNSKIIPWR